MRPRKAASPTATSKTQPQEEAHNQFIQQFLQSSAQVSKQTLAAGLLTWSCFAYIYALKSKSAMEDTSLWILLIMTGIQATHAFATRHNLNIIEHKIAVQANTPENCQAREKELRDLSESTRSFYHFSYLLFLPCCFIMLEGTSRLFHPDRFYNNLAVYLSSIFTYLSGEAYTHISARKRQKNIEEIYSNLVEEAKNPETTIVGQHFELCMSVTKSARNFLRFHFTLNSTSKNSAYGWANIPPHPFFAEVARNVLSKHFANAYWNFKFSEDGSLMVQIIDPNGVDIDEGEILDEIRARLNLALANYEFNSYFTDKQQGTSHQKVVLESNKLDEVTVEYRGSRGDKYTQILSSENLARITQFFESISKLVTAEKRSQHQTKTASLPPAQYDPPIQESSGHAAEPGPGRPRLARAQEPDIEAVVEAISKHAQEAEEVDFGKYGNYHGNNNQNDYQQIHKIEQLYRQDLNCKYYWTCAESIADKITSDDLPFNLSIAHHKKGSKGVIINLSNPQQVSGDNPVLAKYKVPRKDQRIVATQAVIRTTEDGTKHVLLIFSEIRRHKELKTAPKNAKLRIEELPPAQPQPPRPR